MTSNPAVAKGSVRQPKLAVPHPSQAGGRTRPGGRLLAAAAPTRRSLRASRTRDHTASVPPGSFGFRLPWTVRSERSRRGDLNFLYPVGLSGSPVQRGTLGLLVKRRSRIRTGYSQRLSQCSRSGRHLTSLWQPSSLGLLDPQAACSGEGRNRTGVRASGPSMPHLPRWTVRDSNPRAPGAHQAFPRSPASGGPYPGRLAGHAAAVNGGRRGL